MPCTNITPEEITQIVQMVQAANDQLTEAGIRQAITTYCNASAEELVFDDTFVREVTIVAAFNSLNDRMQ